MNAATTSTSKPRLPIRLILILALAGPAMGQPAPLHSALPVPLTGLAQLDAELPEPLAEATLRQLQRLSPSGRQAIDWFLEWMPDGKGGAFFTLLSRAPADHQAATIALLSRLDQQQAMAQGIMLQNAELSEWPDFFALAAALPPSGPYDPTDPASSCMPAAFPSPPGDAVNRCTAAAAAFTLPDVSPEGPGMTTAPPDTAPWQAQLLRAGASARAVLDPRAKARAQLRFGEIRPDWQALHICGAVNIGDGWVLTAAHCIGNGWAGNNAGFFDGRRIRLGSQSIAMGGEIWRIDAVVRHARYRSALQGDDIALLRLAPGPEGEAVSRIGTAALPNPAAPPPRIGQGLQLTGWGVRGVTANGGDDRDADGELQRFSADLLVGTISLMPLSACNESREFARRGRRLGPGQLCAGSRDGVDACKGDSGGPLVMLRPGRAPTLIGLVSHGPGCGLPDTPAAYADVRHYAGWVRAAMAQVQSGRIIDFEPGRCRHDGADVPCTGQRTVQRAGQRP